MASVKKVVALTTLAVGGALIVKKVSTDEKLKEKANKLNNDLKAVKDSSFDMAKEIINKVNDKVAEKVDKLKEKEDFDFEDPETFFDSESDPFYELDKMDANLDKKLDEEFEEPAATNEESTESEESVEESKESVEEEAKERGNNK